jgi:hypothetical protein
LPQDSTLFLVLREQPSMCGSTSSRGSPSAAAALVNVHPDYMSFNRTKGSSEQRRALRTVLSHVQSRFANEAWFVLPREIANYVRACRGFG